MKLILNPREIMTCQARDKKYLKERMKEFKNNSLFFFLVDGCIRFQYG